MADASVLVVGGAVQDVALTVQSRVRQGTLVLPAREKLIATRTERTVGGGGIALSIALAKLGHRVTGVAAIGDDDSGRAVARTLRDGGVRARLATKPVATGMSAVLRSASDDTFHWICEDRGANDRLTWKDVAPSLSPAPHLLVLSHLSGGAHGIIARLARELPEKTALVWNPGTTQVARGVGAARALLRRTDVLIINQREVGEWFGGRQDRAALHRAVEALLRGGVSTVVVTEGKRGANAYEKTKGNVRSTHVASFASKIVDTVGAGDAFIAGFSAEWIRTCDVRRSLTAGSLNAAGTIAVPGTLSGLLSQREMRAGLRKHLG